MRKFPSNMDPEAFDYSLFEVFKPIWISDDLCVCLEGVDPPRDAKVCFTLNSPSYFGTGGHPSTQAILIALIDTDFSGMTTLDFKAGSGLLGIFCAYFHADKVITYNENEKATVMALTNGLQNSVIIVPSTKTELVDCYSRYFDMVVSHQISPHTVRDDMQLISSLLAPSGFCLFSGWSSKEHKFVEGVVGEFFRIQIIGDLAGHPIMKVVNEN